MRVWTLAMVLGAAAAGAILALALRPPDVGAIREKHRAALDLLDALEREMTEFGEESRKLAQEKDQQFRLYQALLDRKNRLWPEYLYLNSPVEIESLETILAEEVRDMESVLGGLIEEENTLRLEMERLEEERGEAQPPRRAILEAEIESARDRLDGVRLTVAGALTDLDQARAVLEDR